MVQIAPIKLLVGPKVLWFDPNGLDIHENDAVIVTTKRGREYGIATRDILDISDSLIEELESPLQPVERIATAEDEVRMNELEQKGDEALAVFRQMVEEAEVDMHPVLVEFLFDGDKAVFYFESEERVDFRELVRKLASHFHVRVDMRQIGVRDGASIIGGLGHCGQELCCKRLGGEFSPVSIRMAKEQNLSLNPQKISGLCGRLMCCLRYEYDCYCEFNARAPKMNAKIETPDGPAKVIEINVPSEVITIQNEEGKTVKVPLADFEKPEEGKRPYKIDPEAYEKLTNSSSLDSFESSAPTVEAVEFVEEVKLADPHKRSRKTDGTQRPEEEQESSSRRRRRRKSSVVQGGDTPEPTQTTPSLRPGHRASGVQQTIHEHERKEEAQIKAGNSSDKPSRNRRGNHAAPESSGHRTRRVRSHSAGTETGSSAPKHEAPKHAKQKQDAQNKHDSHQKQGEKHKAPTTRQQSNQRAEQQGTVNPNHRRTRRRSHTTETGKGSHE